MSATKDVIPPWGNKQRKSSSAPVSTNVGTLPRRSYTLNPLTEEMVSSTYSSDIKVGEVLGERRHRISLSDASDIQEESRVLTPPPESCPVGVCFKRPSPDAPLPTAVPEPSSKSSSSGKTPKRVCSPKIDIPKTSSSKTTEKASPDSPKATTKKTTVLPTKGSSRQEGSSGSDLDRVSSKGSGGGKHSGTPSSPVSPTEEPSEVGSSLLSFINISNISAHWSTDKLTKRRNRSLESNAAVSARKKSEAKQGKDADGGSDSLSLLFSPISPIFPSSVRKKKRSVEDQVTKDDKVTVKAKPKGEESPQVRAGAADAEPTKGACQSTKPKAGASDVSVCDSSSKKGDRCLLQ